MKRTRILSLKKRFTWHRWPEPKDKKIESVYEIAVLLLLFLLFLFVYMKMNKVSVIREELDVACVDRECYYEDTDSVDDKGHHPIVKGSFHPAAHIFYRIPMTDSEYLKEESRREWRSGANLFFYFEERKDVNRICSATEPVYLQRARRSYDSLLASTNPPIDSLKLKPMFYYRHLSHERDNIFFSITRQDTAWKMDDYHFYQNGDYDGLLSHRFTSRNSLQNEGFFSGSYPSWNGQNTMVQYSAEIGNETDFFLFKVHNRLGDPGWLALEDVSQAYFDLKLWACDVDSVTLKIDFVGATEFSLTDPAPDKVTMNSIEFTNQSKISFIYANGLRFHAKFKELENRQNVRLFFLTSVMAALVTIFIVFLVIAAYKVFRKKTAE